jgi:hypothetical protein
MLAALRLGLLLDGMAGLLPLSILGVCMGRSQCPCTGQSPAIVESDTVGQISVFSSVDSGPQAGGRQTSGFDIVRQKCL